MRKLATQGSGLLSDEMEELLARLERTPEPVLARTGPVATEGQALRTILVPLDGSPFAEQALACAEALAEATGCHLVLTRTTQALPDREAEAYLRTVAAGLAKRVSVETAILRGSDVGAIVKELARRHADLVVMATARSRHGRWFHCDPVDTVLAHSSVPALVIPVAERELRGSGGLPIHPRLLVPLDGSTFAEAPLPVAASLAEALDGQLILLRALPIFSSLAPLTGEMFSPYLYDLEDLQATAMD